MLELFGDAVTIEFSCIDGLLNECNFITDYVVDRTLWGKDESGKI